MLLARWRNKQTDLPIPHRFTPTTFIPSLLPVSPQAVSCVHLSPPWNMLFRIHLIREPFPTRDRGPNCCGCWFRTETFRIANDEIGRDEHPVSKPVQLIGIGMISFFVHGHVR
ncbi:hypothetical protein I7I50_02535 [Histoplasma capsulatum G186AR]|uniref:Uncharacterized protein n=1 Tax=Ajellomyces capsulatus TaxID=5037 RepID=A0A8H7Z2E4_AJECA|nr:hypothetical protein I7I52_00802 [Histoplasma capsulatum]QSS71620.1 hypothetical protein I7I50_02535 [Histoplasma capsulatum G186AR]